MEVNNYFDIYRDGEFQSDILNNTHVGAYVFVDYSFYVEGKTLNRKLYCIVQWNYKFNVLNIDFEFCSYERFMWYFKDDEIHDNGVIDEVIVNIFSDEDRKETLLNMRGKISSTIDELQRSLVVLNNILEYDYHEVFED